MLRAADEPGLLDSMCRGIAAAGGYRLACVCYRQQDRHGALIPAAQQGYPGGMAGLRQVITFGDGGNPDASTAVALAIRTGQTRIVRNIGNNPAYAPWCQNMSGYGCCIAIPLRIGSRILRSMRKQCMACCGRWMSRSAGPGSRNCGMRSTPANWRCICSPRSTCAAGASAAPKDWCAGAIRNAAWFRRPNSSTWLNGPS
jgi:hypothetical protein